MIDFNSPPPALDRAVRALREAVRAARVGAAAARDRIAGIRADRDLSEEKRARDIGEVRTAMLASFDDLARSAIVRVGEAVAAVEAAVERKAHPDPFALPEVDLTRATAGESSLAALSRAAIAASATAARQVAAQRAESLLADALTRDPVNGGAKLRRELADAGDPVLERAFDSIAPRVMASASEGARTLLERAQAEIRDARLDPPLRELAGQAGELLGLKDFLLGIRTELEQGELLGTGRSAVLAALEATYPGIAS